MVSASGNDGPGAQGQPPQDAAERRIGDLERQISIVRQEAAKQGLRIEKLTEIGLALSGQRNVDKLFEMVVDEARRLTNADAGTLYIVDDSGKNLNFVVLQNDTMKTRMGGTSGVPITLPPVSLYKEDGSQNHANVSSHVALSGESVNIEDVYVAEGYDFTGTRTYDQATGYRSKSMLVMPMRNHENDIIGVLQLLNAKDPQGGEVVAFSPDITRIVGALASQAAVALTNAQLIRDLQRLLYSFIQSIAAAIDAKSPYTKGHIDRVVKLTMLIAERINAEQTGPFKNLKFSEDELEELKLAAWMHDVGKIVTPEHVVDKSTKLQTIFDRAELIRTRFTLIEKSLQTELLERLLAQASEGAGREAMRTLAADFEKQREILRAERDFVLSCNGPGEFMSDDKITRIKEIAAKTCLIEGEKQPYLSGDEVKNLCIRKGSLTDEERKIIENHAVVTADMLSRLPFPKRLARVPVFAGSHHEKLDGTGYPNRLTKDQLPMQARILAVADVFEALTAKDRPYKKPMNLSQAIKILGFMKKDNHIDPDVFDLFVNGGVYMDYAKAELNPEQIDGPAPGPEPAKK